MQRSKKKVQIFCGPGRTKQAAKDSCDINKIVERFHKTGMLPDMIVKDARYGDFSNVPDYLESCNIVKKAEEQFAALNARVREFFDNDPSKMLEYVNNPMNQSKLVELGLAVPKKVEVNTTVGTVVADASQENSEAVKKAE